MALMSDNDMLSACRSGFWADTTDATNETERLASPVTRCLEALSGRGRLVFCGIMSLAFSGLGAFVLHSSLWLDFLVPPPENISRPFQPYCSTVRLPEDLEIFL
jgi:hypothetical protein